MFRFLCVLSCGLFAVAGVAACEKSDSSRPAENPPAASNSNEPVVPKAPSGPACKVSKDCPAGNVCIIWIAPTGDKANAPACGNEVFSGNGQAVACETDADCQDERLGQVSDIKAFKGRLACGENATLHIKTCTTK